MRKREIHNPDCWFCADWWEPAPLRGSVCSKEGCNKVATCCTAQSETEDGRFVFKRWTYLCREHEDEANSLFFGWLFEQAEAVA